jgi:hypothetical protein
MTRQPLGLDNFRYPGGYFLQERLIRTALPLNRPVGLGPVIFTTASKPDKLEAEWAVLLT